MKRIRMVCAALTMTAVMAFGGSAFAADAPAGVSELPQDKTPAIAAAGVDSPEPAAVVQAHMLSGYAEVVEIAPDEVDSEFIVIKPEDGSYAQQGVRLNISGDTLLVNNQTGETVRLADIKVGDRVYAYYDEAMTRSIPPQSRAYLLLTEVDEGTPARLWTVESWDGDVSGDLVITTDNGGLLVRVPAANWLDGAPQLQNGQRFLAWYDIVALSYPGQATANKAKLLPAADGQGAVYVGYDAADDAEVQDMDNVAVTTATATVTVKELNLDEQYLLVEQPNGAGDLRLNFDLEGENALRVVSAGGLGGALVLEAHYIKPGAQVIVNHNLATTFSLPPQSWLNYVLIYLDDEPPTGMFTVEKIDAGGRFLVEGGSLWIAPPADYAGSTLNVGDSFLAWYDTVAESYPGQTSAAKIVPLHKDMGTLNLVMGDMVFADSVHYTHGVPMVPLRIAAEQLGFAVEWDEASLTAHLTNGKIQTNVRIGEDTFYYASAIPGMVGLTAPQSFGARANWHSDDRTVMYVPAPFFEMLGFTVNVSDKSVTIK